MSNFKINHEICQIYKVLPRHWSVPRFRTHLPFLWCPQAAYILFQKFFMNLIFSLKIKWLFLSLFLNWKKSTEEGVLFFVCWFKIKKEKYQAVNFDFFKAMEDSRSVWPFFSIGLSNLGFTFRHCHGSQLHSRASSLSLGEAALGPQFL